MSIEVTAKRLATRVFELSPKAIDELGFNALRKLMRKAGTLKPGESLQINGRCYEQAWIDRHLRVRENKHASLLNSLTSSARVSLHKRFGETPVIGSLFKLAPRPINAEDVKTLTQKAVTGSRAGEKALTEKEVSNLLHEISELPGMNEARGRDIGDYLKKHGYSREAVANVQEFIQQFKRKKMPWSDFLEGLESLVSLAT